MLKTIVIFDLLFIAFLIFRYWKDSLKQTNSKLLATVYWVFILVLIILVSAWRYK